MKMPWVSVAAHVRRQRTGEAAWRLLKGNLSVGFLKLIDVQTASPFKSHGREAG